MNRSKTCIYQYLQKGQLWFTTIEMIYKYFSYIHVLYIYHNNSIFYKNYKLFLEYIFEVYIKKKRIWTCGNSNLVQWPFVSKEQIRYFIILKYKQLSFFLDNDLMNYEIYIGYYIVKSEILRKCTQNLCNRYNQRNNLHCVIWKPETLSEKKMKSFLNILQESSSE